MTHYIIYSAFFFLTKWTPNAITNKQFWSWLSLLHFMIWGNSSLRVSVEGSRLQEFPEQAAKTHKNFAKTHKNFAKTPRNFAKTHKNFAKTHKNFAKTHKNSQNICKNSQKICKNSQKLCNVILLSIRALYAFRSADGNFLFIHNFHSVHWFHSFRLFHDILHMRFWYKLMKLHIRLSQYVV